MPAQTSCAAPAGTTISAWVPLIVTEASPSGSTSVQMPVFRLPGVELVRPDRGRAGVRRERRIGRAALVSGRVARADLEVIRGAARQSQQRAVRRLQRGRRDGGAVGRARPVGDLGRRGLVRRPGHRGRDRSLGDRSARDLRRRRVTRRRRRGGDDPEVVDQAGEGRRRATGVADERTDRRHGHGMREGGGARPVRPVAGMAKRPLVPCALDPEVGRAAAVDGGVVGARCDTSGDHRREQARGVPVVVDLESQQVVGVLLDDDPLQLVAGAHRAVELHLDLEVLVGDGLQKPGGAERAGPEVVGDAGGQRDRRVRSVRSSAWRRRPDSRTSTGTHRASAR